MKRIYSFDILKSILIIIVVFGHVIEEVGNFGVLNIVWSYIYSFHMPLFVFISGFFSKSSEENIRKNIVGLLFPYIIFGTLFSVLQSGTEIISGLNIYNPKYSFWYIFALFIWRILIKYLEKIKFIFAISIVFGLLCGMFTSVGRLISLSRIICFFPFFYFGYKTTPNTVEIIRGKSKLLFLGIFIVSSAITIIMNVNNLFPYRMYLFLDSYETLNVRFVYGVLFRSIIYVIAFLNVISLINLVPNKKCSLSILGQRTIIVYLLSPFPLKLIFKILNNFYTIPDNYLIKILLIFVFTGIILLVTWNNYIFKFYNTFMQKISNKLIKD